MKLNRYTFMSEESGGEGQGGGGNPPASEEQTNLPSDNLPVNDDGGSVSFEIKPEDLQDGKFMGKWDSPQQMADHIKNIEDKYADTRRDIANQNKQTDEEIQQTAKEQQQMQLQQDTISELAPEFIENGMQLTDEMKDRLKETGLTEERIKLGAYEIKEAVSRNADYVGGKENYDIIMDYHAKNMSDSEKRQFNHSIQNPNNAEALMVGLQAMYERDIANGGGEQQPQDRLRGNPAPSNAIRPYDSKAELLKDKRYADSRASSAADKAKFRARLAATPENVWSS